MITEEKPAHNGHKDSAEPRPQGSTHLAPGASVSASAPNLGQDPAPATVPPYYKDAREKLSARSRLVAIEHEILALQDEKKAIRSALGAKPPKA